eukprot:scaffold846_cov252-Pinguiococcus_pyrenoidosus.AAC.24
MPDFPSRWQMSKDENQASNDKVGAGDSRAVQSSRKPIHPDLPSLVACRLKRVDDLLPTVPFHGAKDICDLRRQGEVLGGASTSQSKREARGQAHLKRHGLYRRAKHVILPRVVREAADRASGIGLPMRRAKAREGGDEVHPSVVRRVCTGLVHLRDVCHELELVPHPVHDAPSRETRPLYGIHARLRANLVCGRGQQAVLGLNDLLAGVHHDESAGAVRGLGHAPVDCRLRAQNRHQNTAEAVGETLPASPVRTELPADPLECR